MNPSTPTLEWRPGWAVAVAVVGIVVSGSSLVVGFVDLGYSYAHPAPWGGQLPNAFPDLSLIFAAVILSIPWLVFLATSRRQPFSWGVVSSGLVALVTMFLLAQS